MVATVIRDWISTWSEAPSEPTGDDAGGGSLHGVDLPSEARARLANDRVVWLTTVTDSGAPAPNPVWFVPDGDDIAVFTAPGSRKVHNIEQRPVVTLHFNSGRDGDDVVVITGTAELAHEQAPSAFPGYLDKYEADITGPLDMTVEEMDAGYSTRIRVRPTRVRLTDGS